MKPAWTFSFHKKAVRNIAFLALLFCGLAGPACAAATPHTYRKTLDQPAEIQGYPCAKGYAWFYDDGRLSRCTVTREISFGEARIPAGSYIALNPDGTPNLVQMSHDAPILGLTCMGGSWLGPAKARWWPFIPAAS
jgi:hypothetical protein